MESIGALLRRRDSVNYSETNQDAEGSIDIDPRLTQTPRSGWQKFIIRFGYYEGLVVLGGTVVNILSAVVLGVFWQWSNRNIPEGSWVYIVSRDWTTRLVTLCTAVIRTCINAQAITCSMMLASLVLEHQEILQKDVPMMSVYQHAYSGPLEITLPLLRALRDVRLKIPRKLPTVALLVLTSTMSQFISTILLSDINTATVLGPIEKRPLAYGSFSGIARNVSNIFFSRPSAYPLFAENKIEGFRITGDTYIAGVSNSGRTVRALFPLSQSERVSLAEYNGPATIISSHFLCAAPKVTNVRVKVLPNSIEFNDDNGNQYTSAVGFGINATIGTSYFSHPREQLKDRDWFNFTFPQINGTVNSDHCILRTGFSICVIDSGNVASTLDEFPSKNYYNSNNHWYFVSNSSWSDGYDYLTWEPAINGHTVEPEFDGSEWTKLRFQGDMKNRITITSSMCLAAIDEVDSKITVKNNVPNFTKPVLRTTVNNSIWQPVNSNFTAAYIVYNTTAIQHQLGIGIGRTSYAERGIFKLSPWDYQVPRQIDTIDHWPELCIGGCGEVDDVLASVFLNTLEVTHDLATAMQAFFAVAYNSAFENSRLLFTKTGNAEMRFFKSHSIPRQFTGYAIVLGIISMHSLLLASIVCRFFRTQSLDEARPIQDPSSSKRNNAVVATKSTTRDNEYVSLQLHSQHGGYLLRSIAGSSDRIPDKDLHVSINSDSSRI